MKPEDRFDQKRDLENDASVREQIDRRPDVSVLIVAYNSADHISACLSALPGACKEHNFEVLLVDNGDGATQTIVEQRFPDVRILQSRGNIGFAAGNNLLARHANADFLLLLNPDMVLTLGSLDALMDAAKKYRSAVAWGGISLSQDGKPDTGNGLSIPSLMELFRHSVGRSANRKRQIQNLMSDARVDVLMGGIVLVSKSAWAKAGGLDERYFLYCEEVDLFYRLQKMGLSFWRISNATGVHDAGHGKEFSPRRHLYRTAGIMQFARSHWSMPEIWIAAVLIWLGALFRFFAGKMLGQWRPRLKKIGDSNQLVVTRPSLWFFGYDPDRGLLARLAASQIKGL